MNLHRQSQLNHITRFPFSCQHSIPFFYRCILHFTINLYYDFLLIGIHIGVQIGRNRPVVNPSRNTKHDTELLFAFRRNCQLDIPFPRIGCFLTHIDALSIPQSDASLISSIQIDVYSCIRSSINVAGNRRHETGQIGRTAGTIEPLAAFRPIFITRKYIRIKELLTIQADATQYGIIQRTLQHIDILGITV